MKRMNVIICGLGAVGLTYASKFKDVSNLKILVDKKRLEKFKTQKPVLNGKEMDFDYILPDGKFDCDLIIISTKADGLGSAIENIKNFVGEKTIILSLLNGISSEEKIANIYGRDKVLHSYFIGHSAVRVENSVTQDGVGKIVFGSPYNENKTKVELLREFLSESGIDFDTPDDIIYSMWLKFTLNIFSNQSSAILNMTFGEMKHSPKFIEFAKKIIEEVKVVAQACGVNNLENLEADSLKALSGMIDEGKTSMHQDILAGRKTEVEIFGGEIIKLGEKYNIPTPYNQVMYDMIKILEEK